MKLDHDRSKLACVAEVFMAPIKRTNRAFSRHVTASRGIETDGARGDAAVFAMASGILKALRYNTASVKSNANLYHKI